MVLVEPGIRTETLSVDRDGRQMGLFVARPAEDAPQPGPGLLVIQEAFGVNGHIRDVAGRFARAGYVVVSPDLYYRTGAWQEFNYGEFDKIRPTMAALTLDGCVADLDAALRTLAGLPGVDGRRLGVVGYCMGGRLSYLAATRFATRLRAAAVYYGGRIVGGEGPGWPEAPIARTGDIRCPMIGFFGGQDASIPEEQVRQIDRELEEAGVPHEVHLYPEAGHGFCCDARPSFHARSAQDAWSRTLDFLRRNV